MNRRHFLKAAAVAASASCWPRWPASADGSDDFKFQPEREIIAAPDQPSLWPEFRRRLDEWRSAKRRELAYSDLWYRRPEFAWTAHNFSCGFLMLCDEAFYDAGSSRYTVKEYLSHQKREFGGYTSVVLWHAYPRIGLDDRNQFDFYRDMPGGLKGLRSAIRELHHAGVKAFIDYNPWDTGTRREPRSDLDALCDLIRSLEADGIFLDTMDRGAAEFRDRLDRVRPGVVLEGEIALPVERVRDHHFSWAQGFQDRSVPGVLRNKWFERRHLQHQINRWEFDHSQELHIAWMNGSGMMVWENVFGSWMGWNARDKSMLRQMLPIQRYFADLFVGEAWTPLVPTLGAGIFASLWERDGVRLWTVVNRSSELFSGDLLALELNPGEKVIDVINGRQAEVRSLNQDEIRSDAKPRPNVESRALSSLIVRGIIPPRGLGCLVAARLDVLGRSFAGLLKDQRKLATQCSLDRSFPARSTRLKPSPAAPAKSASAPKGTVVIPAAALTLRSELRERECGFYESSPAGGPRFTDVYNFRVRSFAHTVALSRFAMDLTPVTNAQFAEFIRAVHYRPKHPENLLKHWIHGVPPAGKEDHPVVYVDLDDARAYARWKGQRLPTEDEWQYAAQGPSALQYPWGQALLPNRCNGGEHGGTTPVMQFPDGRSPFGIWDLCGNVWEWTESERTDGRTRFCILKGGSFYTARGSGWYMDGGPRPNDFGAKFLMMWPGLDRCATVGFRCVAELA
jgi:formylglycine-generating enzyme required for sulfatase activity